MFTFKRLSWKLVMIFALITFLCTSAISCYAVYNTTQKITSAAQEKLGSDLNVVKSYFDKQIKGSWAVKEGKLYKGNVLMNENGIVEEVQEMTGDHVTIFLDDVRIATTVRNSDGTRALGTQAAEEVSETVLGNQQTFIGKAEVVGIVNQTIYEPILDDAGNAIGMLFVGVPNAPYEKLITDFMKNLLLFVLVEVFVTAVIIYYVSSKITKPLEQLAGAAEKVASGDFTGKIDVNAQDEVGTLANAMKGMVAGLCMLIQQIKETSDQVAAASEELHANTEQSSQATAQVAATASNVMEDAEKQTNLVEATVLVVEQMSGGIQQVAANAATMSSMADHTTSAATQGQKAIEAAMNQMKTIEESVSNSAQVVAKLGERSKEIGQIVNTISGIADQTNLLALNAAIEAARAGEQGRGFAVVAEEVRKLAEQVQEAAKHISQLISEIQTDTDRAVVTMDAGTREVKAGADVVNSAGRGFQEIVANVNEVTSQIKEISNSMQQVATGIQQIVAAVKDIDRIGKVTAGETQTVLAATEEQSASMEQIAAFSQALAKMAEELQLVIKKFKV